MAKCSSFKDWRYLLALSACQATSPQLLDHLVSLSVLSGPRAVLLHDAEAIHQPFLHD